MSNGYNQDNDAQTGNSTDAQNAGNQSSGQLEQQGERAEGGFGQQQQQQQGQGQSGAGYGDQGGQGATGMSGTGSDSTYGQGQQDQDSDFANDDESRGGPPTGEQLGDDTGGFVSDDGARTGGMSQSGDALGSASGSEYDEDEEDSDTLQGQTSSGAV